MRTLVISVVLSFVLFSAAPTIVYADCNYYEVDPECLINGQTKTDSCAGRSDTSSWSLPVAHSSVCREAISLPVWVMRYIDLAVIDYFSPYAEYEYDIDGKWSRTSVFDDIPEGSKYTMLLAGEMTMLDLHPDSPKRTTGITLARDMFATIAIKLGELRQQEYTDEVKRKTSVLYYIASLVGYDYAFPQKVK